MVLPAQLAILSGAPAADPGWNAILLLGVLAGLLCLDESALLQTWFSQPLPAGVLAGALCGDPISGLAIGLPVQLILAGNLPVGQSFIGDPVTVLVAAVGAAVVSGDGLMPAFGSVGMEELALVGWLIVAVGLFSSAGHVMIQMERRAHSIWMLEGHRTLRDGRLRRMDGIHLRCLLATFLRGFVTTVILVLVLGRFWLPAFAVLPSPVVLALAMLPLLLPGLGIGTLIERYGLRSHWVWVAGGAVVSFAVTRFVL